MAEEPRRSGITLFQITVPICAAVGAVGIAYPNAFGDAASFATNLFFGALDWFFIATVTGLLLLSGVVARETRRAFGSDGGRR